MRTKLFQFNFLAIIQNLISHCIRCLKFLAKQFRQTFAPEEVSSYLNYKCNTFSKSEKRDHDHFPKLIIAVGQIDTS